MPIQISPYYNREGMIQGSWSVYVDKEIVRFEHTIGSGEGQAKLNQIKAAFPDYVNFDRNEFNVVGSFDAYREPYSNPSISFYDYGVKPSADLLSDHGVTIAPSIMKTWYGLKFDLTTLEVLLKVVAESVDFATPELPDAYTFFATTHSSDGEVSDWVDAYVVCLPLVMREFCVRKGLRYPLPQAVEDKDSGLVVFGVVFNKATQAYGVVKAYPNLYPHKP
jgi:hypothetical protein